MTPTFTHFDPRTFSTYVIVRNLDGSFDHALQQLDRLGADTRCYETLEELPQHVRDEVEEKLKPKSK